MTNYDRLKYKYLPTKDELIDNITNNFVACHVCPAVADCEALEDNTISCHEFLEQWLGVESQYLTIEYKCGCLMIRRFYGADDKKHMMESAQDSKNRLCGKCVGYVGVKK